MKCQVAEAPTVLVYLCSAGARALGATLAHLLKGDGRRFDLRPVSAPHPLRHLERESVLCLDLVRPVPGLSPKYVAWSRPLDLVLLTQPQQLVPCEWLQIVRQRLPTVVVIQPDTPWAYGELLAFLGTRARLIPDPLSLTDTVLAELRFLQPISNVVDAVLTRPWEIRRPHQLSAALHLSLREVRKRAHRVGVHRVDHLITFVRAQALDILTRRGTPHRIALQAVGIADEGNFARQRGRAAYLADGKTA